MEDIYTTTIAGALVAGLCIGWLLNMAHAWLRIYFFKRGLHYCADCAEWNRLPNGSWSLRKTCPNFDSHPSHEGIACDHFRKRPRRHAAMTYAEQVKP